MSKRILNRFLDNDIVFEFGDYILFQEYKQDPGDGTQYSYKISKPILAIYLGCFVADQTLGFNYVRWNNENHTVHSENGYPHRKEVDKIECHIEWSDYVDILGHWKIKPKWKQIIEKYRNQNLKSEMISDEIEWNSLY